MAIVELTGATPEDVLREALYEILMICEDTQFHVLINPAISINQIQSIAGKTLRGDKYQGWTLYDRSKRR